MFKFLLNIFIFICVGLSVNGQPMAMLLHKSGCTNPSAISGTLTVATSATTQLSSSPSGGTWSSTTTTVATIGTTGLVTGVAAGTSTISYVVTSGCHAIATVTVTSSFSYNTFDPSNKAASITVSGGNLTAGNASYTFACIFGLASNAHSTGKYYCEMTINNVGGSGNQSGFGFGNASANLNNYLGSDANGWWYWSQVGAISNFYNSGAALSPIPTLVYVYGDVIGMALDLTAGKAWFSVNGTWNNSGNPSSGTSPSFTFPTGITYYPIACFFWGGATINFGATTYFSTAPSGFSNW